MKTVFYKTQTGRTLLLAVLALLIACIFTACKPSTPTTDQGLTELQRENLYTLCKVWGATKYYHPAFTTGAKDWDEDLLTLLPQVMSAKDSAAVNALLVDWIKGLDAIQPNEPSSQYKDGYVGTKHKKLEPDLGWFHDGSISSDLSALLVPLMNTAVQVGAGGPMILTEFGKSSFQMVGKRNESASNPILSVSQSSPESRRDVMSCWRKQSNTSPAKQATRFFAIYANQKESIRQPDGLLFL